MPTTYAFTTTVFCPFARLNFDARHLLVFDEAARKLTFLVARSKSAAAGSVLLNDTGSQEAHDWIAAQVASRGLVQTDPPPETHPPIVADHAPEPEPEHEPVE